MSTNYTEGKILFIPEDSEGLQLLDISIDKEDGGHEYIRVENNYGGYLSGQKFEPGEHIVLAQTVTPEGQVQWSAVDHVRRPSLLLLFVLFVVAVLAINRVKGLMALLSMAVSFAVLFLLILPLILAGYSPILSALLGALFILPASFYLSHGMNKKTTIAAVGTFISLVFTGVLAAIFTQVANITGFASEEAAFLFTGGREAINFKGLVLAGIMIALMGVLDDVCITQSSVAEQLKKNNPKIGFKKLFHSTMEVGKDHVASVVNTLVLVYTGASLPLLLLFMDSSQSIAQILNYELVAEEVVRTLVGSIGIVLAVPITTLLAAWFNTKK